MTSILIARPKTERPQARLGRSFSGFHRLLISSVLVGMALAAAATTMAWEEAAAQTRRSIEDAGAFATDADAWMTDALSRLSIVPSTAIAVVVDDRVVLTQGWGTADLENGIPATEETVYYIASATKSYFALAAAILDARGDIDLDSALAAHLHGVEIDEALVPDKVTLRDLLTHTSGIDNGPIATRLAYTGEHDPETLWKLLAHSTPMKDAPLGVHRYTNVGYNILGMILDRELGKPWQDVLRDEVFEPLGMHRTTAYASKVKKMGWPLAAPYFGLYPDGIRRQYLEKQDNTMQSAGGMMTTARDLGRWLNFQINDGLLDGQVVVPAEIVRGTRERLTEASGRPPFESDHYGLGWFLGTYHDRTIVHHSGGFPGFRSLVSFCPEERVGVAVLTNEASIGSRFADVAAQWIYEWWFDVLPANQQADAKVAEYEQAKEPLQQRMADQVKTFAERKWMLSRPLDSYAGTYVNDLWGTVEVAVEGGRLRVRSGNLHCLATAYEKEETARLELVPGSGIVIQFAPAEGEVAQATVDGDVYRRID